MTPLPRQLDGISKSVGMSTLALHAGELHQKPETQLPTQLFARRPIPFPTRRR